MKVLGRLLICTSLLYTFSPIAASTDPGTLMTKRDVYLFLSQLLELGDLNADFQFNERDAYVAVTNLLDLHDPSTGPQLTERDAYILLSNLLRPFGSESDDQAALARYREWERVLIKFSGDRKRTKSQMKIYLFIAFIADQSVMAHTQEEIGHEIVDVFARQSPLILGILNEFPFLIPSTCVSLRDHFVFFGTQTKNEEFIRKYAVEIFKILPRQQAKLCMRKLSY